MWNYTFLAEVFNFVIGVGYIFILVNYSFLRRIKLAFIVADEHSDLNAIQRETKGQRFKVADARMSKALMENYTFPIRRPYLIPYIYRYIQE
jgi:hypothetical protein